MPELSRPNSESAHRDTQDQVIVGHTPRGYLLLAAFPLVLGVAGFFGMYYSSPNSGSLGVTLVIAAMCSFPFLLGVISLWLFARTCVIADENGLRWRDFGKWHSATWAQVRDYYSRTKPKSGTTYYVETDAGQLSLNTLTQSALLRQAIQERARWAKATTWEERGADGETLELNETETYLTDQSVVVIFWFFLALGIFVMPALSASCFGPGLLQVPSWFLQMWQTLGFWYALGSLAPLCFHTFIMGLMLCAIWPAARAAQQRKHQSITVSPFGLLWRNSATGQEVNAAWRDVRDFYVSEVPGWVKSDRLAVVETTHGKLDFLLSGSGGKRGDRRLRALIQKYCAMHGLNQEWDTREKYTTLITNANESGLEVFTYRDSPLRAMIYFITFLAGQFCYTAFARYVGIIAVRGQAPYNPSDLLMGLVFGGSLSAASIWMWWQYICFQIQIDQHGLTQRCGRKERFIAWPDVQEYDVVSGWGIVRSKTETIRFYVAIGRCSELQKIIKERAVNSRTKSW